MRFLWLGTERCGAIEHPALVFLAKSIAFLVGAEKVMGFASAQSILRLLIAGENSGLSGDMTKYQIAGIIGSAVAQGGTFDYQRENGIFYSDYTQASNYGIGVYMFGAGYTEAQMDAIGLSYARSNSAAGNNSVRLQEWNQGYLDAAGGAFSGGH